MKKRNWLMTIAFAVLSLTIVSTMVIGTTYAKFTSRVDGQASAQAAGFLIAGSVADETIEGLMAPGENFTTQVAITYFSQVPTKISEASATGSGLTGTGVFDTSFDESNSETIADSTWGKLLAIYNANVTALANATGATGVAVASNLLPTDLITYTAGSGVSTVEAFIAQVYTNLSNKATVYGASSELRTSGDTGVTYNDVIPAMLSTVDAVQTANLSINVAWTTLTGNGKGTGSGANDLFDTFLGAAIAGLATGTDVTIGGVDIIGGTSTIQFEVDQGTSEVIPVESRIGFTVGLKAEQVAQSDYENLTPYVAQP